MSKKKIFKFHEKKEIFFPFAFQRDKFCFFRKKMINQFFLEVVLPHLGGRWWPLIAVNRASWEFLDSDMVPQWKRWFNLDTLDEVENGIPVFLFCHSRKWVISRLRRLQRLQCWKELDFLVDRQVVHPMTLYRVSWRHLQPPKQISSILEHYFPDHQDLDQVSFSHFEKYGGWKLLTQLDKAQLHALPFCREAWYEVPQLEHRSLHSSSSSGTDLMEFLWEREIVSLKKACWWGMLMWGQFDHLDRWCHLNPDWLVDALSHSEEKSGDLVSSLDRHLRTQFNGIFSWKFIQVLECPSPSSAKNPLVKALLVDRGCKPLTWLRIKIFFLNCLRHRWTGGPLSRRSTQKCQKHDLRLLHLWQRHILPDLHLVTTAEGEIRFLLLRLVIRSEGESIHDMVCFPQFYASVIQCLSQLAKLDIHPDAPLIPLEEIFVDDPEVPFLVKKSLPFLSELKRRHWRRPEKLLFQTFKSNVTRLQVESALQLGDRLMNFLLSTRWRHSRSDSSADPTKGQLLIDKIVSLCFFHPRLLEWFEIQREVLKSSLPEFEIPVIPSPGCAFSHFTHSTRYDSCPLCCYVTTETTAEADRQRATLLLKLVRRPSFLCLRALLMCVSQIHVMRREYLFALCEMTERSLQHLAPTQRDELVQDLWSRLLLPSNYKLGHNVLVYWRVLRLLQHPLLLPSFRLLYPGSVSDEDPPPPVQLVQMALELPSGCVLLRELCRDPHVQPFVDKALSHLSESRDTPHSLFSFLKK